MLDNCGQRTKVTRSTRRETNFLRFDGSHEEHAGHSEHVSGRKARRRSHGFSCGGLTRSSRCGAQAARGRSSAGARRELRRAPPACSCAARQRVTQSRCVRAARLQRTFRSPYYPLNPLINLDPLIKPLGAVSTRAVISLWLSTFIGPAYRLFPHTRGNSIQA